ncbi:hypothetical protein LCGC14_1545480 [marine sediment metagenome]|uniref:Uncharacterized protein n=1 Tax=marine sediment metagenome TaxID=412755 RepID=A0A0F9IRN6_9ZZZZ
MKLILAGGTCSACIYGKFYSQFTPHMACLAQNTKFVDFRGICPKFVWNIYGLEYKKL